MLALLSDWGPACRPHSSLKRGLNPRTLGAMKFAICNEIFKGWQLDKVFSYVAQLGYNALEIAPFTLANSVTEISAAERKKIREAASREGVEIAGIHWVLVKPEGLYINHPETEVRQRTSNYLGDLVDFCADVGGGRMVVGSPKQRNVVEGISAEQARRWAAETFKEPVARAEHREVTICLEPLSPAETNFINTAAEAIEFIAPFSSPRFQIILDVKAMCSETKSIPEIIRDSWPRFAHFHANDPNLKGPGFGDVDFKPIAAALKQVGYQGFVSVEVFNFDEGPEVIASKSLDYLRLVFV